MKVTAVEVRDVTLPDTMKRAMARQAETERERRAKVINAEGEFQAAEKLVQAAAMIADAAHRAATALPADHQRDFRRPQHHHHHSAAHRIDSPRSSRSRRRERQETAEVKG